MNVKDDPTLGWTRGTVASTILFVTQQQRDALAQRVRVEMGRRGWNNPKLAREAELSEKTISRVINARKDSRLDTIERIAAAFDMAVKELLGTDEQQTTQLDRMEQQLTDLHNHFLGNPAGAGIADRLALGDDPPPSQDDEPLGTDEEDDAQQTS